MFLSREREKSLFFMIFFVSVLLFMIRRQESEEVEDIELGWLCWCGCGGGGRDFFYDVVFREMASHVATRTLTCSSLAWV